MQLNIHIPKDREGLLLRLETRALETGTPKNQIVLEALAAALGTDFQKHQPRLRTADMGIFQVSRNDLYADILQPSDDR